MGVVPVPASGCYIGSSTPPGHSVAEYDGLLAAAVPGASLHANREYYHIDTTTIPAGHAGSYGWFSFRADTIGGTIYTWNSIAAGVHDANIIAIADALHTYSDPCWVTFNHEPVHSANNVIVGVCTVSDVSTAGHATTIANEWKSAYEHFVNTIKARYTAQGWTLNCSFAPILQHFQWQQPSTYTMSQWIPSVGVDWMAVDTYGTAMTSSFWSAYQAFYNWCGVNLPGVPLANCETQHTTSLPTWLYTDPPATGSLNADMPNLMPNMKTWFYWNNNSATDWTVTSQDITAFAHLSVAEQVAASDFGLPDTNDGHVHRGCSFDYYAGGIIAEGGNTALQNAQLLASLIDITLGNMTIKLDGVSVQSDKYKGLAAAMRVVNPDLKVIAYRKSVQAGADEDFGGSVATAFPNNYYSHACPWPTGAKITVGSSTGGGTISVYVMQPSAAAGQSPFVDPRYGFTVHSWKEWRSRDAWAAIAAYNAIYGAGVMGGVYHDSMGPSSYNGLECNPDTGAAYTEDAWLAKVRECGDMTRSLKPSPADMLVANGLINGGSYFGIHHLSGLLDHVDGGLAEAWLRSNYGSPTAFHTEAQWKQDVDMVIDANVTRGKWFWGVINLCNDQAGSGVCSFTDADRERWRRYAIATYMIAKRSYAVMEFVQDITTMPWREDHPYYHLDLGTPIDNAASAAASLVGGCYRRRFANGVAYVNPTAGSVTVTCDRDYVDPVAMTTHASGSTFSLQSNRGLIFVTAPPVVVNPDSPVITVVSPAEGSTVPDSLVHLVVDASDSDGIASVEAKVGAGAYGPMVLNAGHWSASITLPALGANTISVRATDNNAAPNQTVHTFSLTLAANAAAPTVTILAPTGTVTTTPQTITLQIDDTDGIASADVNLNAAGWEPAAYDSVSGHWLLSKNLLVGANSIQARATDARTPDPLTSDPVTGTVSFLTLPTKYATRRGCFAIDSTPDARTSYAALPSMKVIGVTVNMDAIWPKQSLGPKWPSALRQSFIDAKLKGYKILVIPQAGRHSPAWVYADVQKVLTKLDSASQAVTPQPVYWDADYYQGHWPVWHDAITTFLRAPIGDTSTDTREEFCAGLMILPGSDIGYDMTTLAEATNQPIWDAATGTSQATRQGLMAAVWADGIAHALANKPDCPLIVPYGQLHGDSFAYALTIPAEFAGSFGSGDLIGMTTNLIEHDNGAACGSQTLAGAYSVAKPLPWQCLENTVAVGGFLALRLASFQGGFDQFTCFSDPDGATRAALLDACDTLLPNLKLLGGTVANYQGVEIAAAHPWPVEAYANGTIQPRVIAGA